MIIILFLFYFFIINNSEKIISPSKLSAAIYPSWANGHWVWLSSGESNEESQYKLIHDYLNHDIPVQAVDIDSGWSTGYNNFIWDPKKFPNPKKMIDYFHSLGIKIILWVTSVVNVDSTNYKYGYDHDYYLNWGKTVKWWHGVGSFIDYTNSDAVKWWHQQMDNVLDLGIDGWKVDGTDPFVMEFLIIVGRGGILTPREYANYYYRDFFYYTRTKNNQSLIMARPVDSWKEFYYTFAPRDVVFSGWVGDQDPTFSGLRDALRNMFHSAWDNYVNFGSDIGGYRSGSNPLGRTKELFLRWAQLGAFTPLMENGGNPEHRPWKFDNETCDIYRKFVHIHLELLPYLLNAGTEAYNTGSSVMIPQATWTIFDPNSWSYNLWKDIFVSPIVKENSTYVSITFPDKDDWVDWWNKSKIYKSGSIVNYDVSSLAIFPVFHRKGSIIPLIVNSDITGHGQKLSSGSITLLISQLYTKNKKQETVIRNDFNEQNELILAQEISYIYNLTSYSLLMKATAHPKNSFIILIKGIKSNCENFKICFIIEDLLKEIQLSPVSNINVLLKNQQYYKNNKKYVGQWFFDQNELWITIPSTLNGMLLNIKNIQNMEYNYIN